MPVTIDSAFSGETFIQLWRMTSVAQQKAWLATMH
jgi:hypothetical protein